MAAQCYRRKAARVSFTVSAALCVCAPPSNGVIAATLSQVETPIYNAGVSQRGSSTHPAPTLDNGVREPDGHPLRERGAARPPRAGQHLRGAVSWDLLWLDVRVLRRPIRAGCRRRLTAPADCTGSPCTRCTDISGYTQPTQSFTRLMCVRVWSAYACRSLLALACRFYSLCTSRLWSVEGRRS